MTKKYDITIYPNRKVIAIFVGGAAKLEEVQEFKRDYERAVNSVDTSAYTLEIDCTNMDVVTPQMVPELEGSYQLYKQSGFMKVIFKIKNSAILKMQLSRLARNTGLTQAEIVKV